MQGGDAAFNPARNLTRNTRQYAFTAVGLSLVSGVAGPPAAARNMSFYLNTSAGAGDMPSGKICPDSYI